MPLDRESLLKAAAALPYIDVPVPELGDGATVRLRMMSGVERDKWDEFVTSKKDGSLKDARPYLVGLCAVDENGNRLFTDDDIASVNQLPGVTLEKLWNSAFKQNGLGADAVEEAAKN